MVHKTMKLIEQGKKVISFRYDIFAKNIDDIFHASKNPGELICNGFYFGYMQGMKAAKATDKSLTPLQTRVIKLICKIKNETLLRRIEKLVAYWYVHLEPKESCTGATLTSSVGQDEERAAPTKENGSINKNH